jgi:hypothetical protein
MSVYGHNHENWEDSVARDPELYEKYNDKSKLTSRLKQIQRDRKNM